MEDVTSYDFHFPRLASPKSVERIKNESQELGEDLDRSSRDHTKNLRDIDSLQSLRKLEIFRLKKELTFCNQSLEGARKEIKNLRDKNKFCEKLLAECQSTSLIEKKDSQNMIHEIKDLLERSEHLLRDTRKQNQILKNENKNKNLTIPLTTHKYIQIVSKNTSFDQGLEEKFIVDDQNRSVHESIGIEELEEALVALLFRFKQKGRTHHCEDLCQNRSLRHSMRLSIVAQKFGYGMGAILIELKKCQAVLSAFIRTCVESLG